MREERTEKALMMEEKPVTLQPSQRTPSPQAPPQTVDEAAEEKTRRAWFQAWQNRAGCLQTQYSSMTQMDQIPTSISGFFSVLTPRESINTLPVLDLRVSQREKTELH
jgi:hypothetical protein